MRACAQISPAPRRGPAAPRFCPIVQAGASSQCGFSCLRRGVTLSHVGPIVRVIEGDPGASRCGRRFSREPPRERGGRRAHVPPEPARPRERSLVSRTVCPGRRGPAVLARLFSGDRETDRGMHDCLWLVMPVVSGEHPPTPERVPRLSPLLVSLSRASPMFRGHLVGLAARGPRRLVDALWCLDLGWRLCRCWPGALRPLSLVPFLSSVCFLPCPHSLLPHVCSTHCQAGRPPGGQHLCAPDSRSPVTEKALIGLQSSVYVVGRRETGCWVLRTTNTVCPGLLKQGGRAHSGVRAHVSWDRGVHQRGDTCG